MQNTSDLTFILKVVIFNHVVKYDPGDIDNIFIALAHPVRRSILERLKSSDASVSELAEPHAISMPAVTKHLKILERAGLIAREKKGQVRQIRLQAGKLKAASEWIERYRIFWETQLNQLEEFLLDEDK